jgi:hypothetical protein
MSNTPNERPQWSEYVGMKKKISSEKNIFFEKKNFFENLFNSAVMMVGVQSNASSERSCRAILKSENRLNLSILEFELFAI